MTVVRDGDRRHVFDRDSRATFVCRSARARRRRRRACDHLTAPMAGMVVAVVKAGDAVAKGAPLMILEAMKMERTIAAPAGIVTRSTSD